MRFKMQDFGEASTILGIRIQRDIKHGLLTLDQSKYAKAILQRFCMEACKGVSIPLSPTTHCSKEQSPTSDEDKEFMKTIPYRQVVGSLMYLMVSTRPDLADHVQILSRYGSYPGVTHWKGVKKVLQYVQHTLDYGLVFRRGVGTSLEAYCDADFSSCLDTSRSNGGYVFLLGGAAISWSSKRQSVVAQSTCEAEYMTMNQAAREAIWASQLLDELGYPQCPVTIYSDSESAISLSKNAVIGPKSKHIKRQEHFIRDCLKEDDIVVKYVNTIAKSQMR